MVKGLKMEAAHTPHTKNFKQSTLQDPVYIWLLPYRRHTKDNNYCQFQIKLYSPKNSTFVIYSTFLCNTDTYYSSFQWLQFKRLMGHTDIFSF